MAASESYENLKIATRKWLQQVKEAGISIYVGGEYYNTFDGFMWERILLSPKNNSEGLHDYAVIHGEGACLDSSCKLYFARFDPLLGTLTPAKGGKKIFGVTTLQLIALFEGTPRFLEVKAEDEKSPHIRIRIPSSLNFTTSMFDMNPETAIEMNYLKRELMVLHSHDSRIRYLEPSPYGFDSYLHSPVLYDLHPFRFSFCSAFADSSAPCPSSLSFSEIYAMQFFFHPHDLQVTFPDQFFSLLYPRKEIFLDFYRSLIFFGHGDRGGRSNDALRPFRMFFPKKWSRIQVPQFKGFLTYHPQVE